MIFIKLGGSVITNKHTPETADIATIDQLAAEIVAARQARPDLRVIVGHGSGSFGHVYAARYGIHKGMAPDANPIGLALTGAAALRLNRIVVDRLLATGLPALSLQPAATALCAEGKLEHWDTANIQRALDRGLVPIIHGDISFDRVQGSAICSTEMLLSYLALQTTLRPQKIILVGEAAVYTANPETDPTAQPIPLITSDTIEQVLRGAGASTAVDVTGGMRSKLELMWSLIQAVPHLEVQLIGPGLGLLAAALRNEMPKMGTTIRRG